MDKFWQLLQESVIVQALVTLVLISTLCFMFATGRPIPDLLGWITTAVIGFWFGSKSQSVINRSKKA